MFCSNSDWSPFLFVTVSLAALCSLLCHISNSTVGRSLSLCYLIWLTNKLGKSGLNLATESARKSTDEESNSEAGEAEDTILHILGILDTRAHTLKEKVSRCLIILDPEQLESLQIFKAGSGYKEEFSSIDKLTDDLKHLKISKSENLIRELNLSFFQSLKSLDVNGAPYENLKGIDMKRMEAVSFNKAGIVEIDKFLACTSQNPAGSELETLRKTDLKAVRLRNNQIKEFYSHLFPLLQSLDLTNNKLHGKITLEIQQYIYQDMPNLSHVVLDENGICGLVLIGPSNALTHLSIRNNNLSRLSGLDGAPFLQVLYLDGNQLKTVPRLTNQSALRELKLAGNEIDRVIVDGSTLSEAERKSKEWDEDYEPKPRDEKKIINFNSDVQSSPVDRSSENYKEFHELFGHQQSREQVLRGPNFSALVRSPF